METIQFKGREQLKNQKKGSTGSRLFERGKGKGKQIKFLRT